MDEDNNNDWIDSIIRNWYIIILIFVYFFFKGKWGFAEFDKAQFYAIMGILLIFTGKMFWEWGKYKSPQLVWYNGSASINHNDTLNVGDWRIFRLGGIDYGYLSFPGFEGVLICPGLNVESIRNNEATPIRTQRINLKELPEEVIEELVKNKYPTKKILLGFASYKYELNHKNVLDFEAMQKQQNSRISELRDMLMGKFKVVEDSVDHSLRVLRKTKGSILERLFSGRGRQDDNM